MKLVRVEALPPKAKRRYPAVRNDLTKIVDGFVQDTDAEIVRVEYRANEYLDIHACRAALANAINRCGFPIDIRIVNDDIYLIKK